MSGRPPAREVVIAVDVGGTSVKAALVTGDGWAVHRDTRTTAHGADGVRALRDQVRALATEARDRDLALVGAGVVTPGIVDEASGDVRFAANLGWRDVPLRTLLTDDLRVPVATGHDVRAAGLAERLVGAGRGLDDFVLVALGTGVAAALFTSGHAVTGVGGASGELGHVPVLPDGERCPCGQRGCLEVYASGGGVARRYASRTGRSRPAAEVVARLGHDTDAQSVWADAVRALALGLVGVTVLLDPSVVVIGGGVARAGDALLTPLRRALADGLAWRPAPQVRLSGLGSDAGWLGAAALAFDRAGRGDVVATWRSPVAACG